MLDINSNSVDFAKYIAGKNCIIIAYPKMGESGKFLPSELTDLKGLTGCTIQCKSYQARLDELLNFGFEVIAVGSKDVEKTKEFKDSVSANFTFFSDQNFELEKLLNLETFSTGDGNKFYHRQTLIIKNGEVVKRFDRIKEPQDDVINVIEAVKNLA